MAIGLTVAGLMAKGDWKLLLGLIAGILFGVLAWVRETPPDRIENWRWGSEGERQTAKALRRLPSPEWQVWHDLQRADKTNIDHVVVGPPGVFLLDTKNWALRTTVDDAGLHLQWPEDPDMMSVDNRIFASLGAASAELKETIESATGVRSWVQPVVVFWGSFDQQVAEVNNVAFVHGRALSQWLLSRPPRGRANSSMIGSFLDGAARDGIASRKNNET